MTDLLILMSAFFNSILKERRDLALENLALRQQLVVLKRSGKRLAIKKKDRVFWVWLSRFWREWRESLIIVKPETVVGWHRKRFRLYWMKLSRHRYGGRPAVGPKVKALIEQMTQANPLWGAPRIHGELLKLGIEVSERTVSRLIPKQPKPPSQTWRTFLENHLNELISIDFFTVPTANHRSLSGRDSAALPLEGSRPNLRRRVPPADSLHEDRGSHYSRPESLAKSIRGKKNRFDSSRVFGSHDCAQ